MTLRLTVILFVLFSLVQAPQGFAEDADVMHRQSAFLFAKRKIWNDAILHAKAAHNAVLVKYFTWEYLKDPQSGASFDSIVRFMEENPGWPDKATLEKRAEVALMSGNPSDTVLAEWFQKHPPQTNLVRLKMAKDEKELDAMIRHAWVMDNYDSTTEKAVLAKYHAVLRPVDHIRRVDRLLWEGNEDEAKRLLKFVSTDHQKLFQARMALADDKLSVPMALHRVPKSLRGDLGLLYERLKWHVRHNDRDGVRGSLASMPNEVPYPEKWWGMRERQVRAAIGEGNINLAERLLARHGQKRDTPGYKEAEWLKGWIVLKYRKAPQKAYAIFTALLEQTETPGSKARAAYWAARAAEKMVKTDPARWYGEASRYPTTFYGQLAFWELNKYDQNRHGHPVKSNNLPTPEEKQRFRQHELVQLVYALAAANESDAASKFIYYLAQNAQSGNEAIMAADLGREIHRIDFSVRAAKKILQRDIISLDNGWPVIAVPTNTAIDKALLLALSRQESEFYAGAVSPSGAYGLMQLLPATAKETARKNGLSYSSDDLFEPQYNMALGSIYMNMLVTKFSGSYVLAVASYNAGPGRVRQWLGEFGRPTADVRETVDWIEKIPTEETRNYVEHVFENMEVYRFLLAGKAFVRTMIADDLVRSSGL